MKQHDAVIQSIERLGGIATLGRLNQEVLKIENCEWRTKTPFASIRRIVQLRPEIYKIKPGLYGLVSHRQQNEAKGVLAETSANKDSGAIKESNHTYYQGLLLTLGKLRKHDTFAPNQDKNRKFLDAPLKDVRTLDSLPPFSYEPLVNRSRTIDVIWFNERMMPHSFYEVESSTNIDNSLGKFHDLQDFYVRMFIVADKARRAEYEMKLSRGYFKDVKSRVQFLDYESLVKQYEQAVELEQIMIRI